MNHESEPAFVNRNDSSSQALELTPWVWIVLALAALLAMARWISDRDELQTLVYLEKDDPVIVRASVGTHYFPRLGIQVTLPEGWSYLSVTDDATADQLTFVNESTHSIVSLRRFLFQSWPPFESNTVTEQYGEVAIEWINVDHRGVGRLTAGDVEVTVMAMTHARKSQRNQSIDELCKGIGVLVAAD